MLIPVKTPQPVSPARNRTATPPSRDDGSKYSVPVVRSTFRILEELSHSEQLGLREVTAITGIAKSTVFRILTTLVSLGYVLRDADRNYHISPTLGQLTSKSASSDTLRSLALPYMLDLRNRYGETVNLGVQQFDKITYIEVVPSEFALRLQESRGSSVPAHASALGKAILAFSAPHVVEQLIRVYPLERVTTNTITDPTELLSELKRVRSAGFAFDRGEGSSLAVCVGAPILDEDNHAIAAMSISGPASRFHPKKDSPVILALLKATNEIGHALGRPALHR